LELLASAIWKEVHGLLSAIRLLNIDVNRRWLGQREEGFGGHFLHVVSVLLQFIIWRVAVFVSFWQGFNVPVVVVGTFQLFLGSPDPALHFGLLWHQVLVSVGPVGVSLRSVDLPSRILSELLHICEFPSLLLINMTDL
jgi:hypothetical protein